MLLYPKQRLSLNNLFQTVIKMKIAIDPGKAGGIAWVDENNEIHARKMPDTPKDILEFLTKFSGFSCCVEQVGGYMPGNSGPAAVKFARHCGHLDMALLACAISTKSVLPSKWQHYLIGKPNYPKIPKETPPNIRRGILAKRKTERKNKIKMNVQARYPHLKVTLATSDTLGILTWFMEGG